MNMKATLFLCSLLIGATPTVVKQLGPPRAPVYATLATGQLPPELRYAWNSAGLTDGADGDWRAARARRLLRPSALALEPEDTGQSDTLAVLPAERPTNPTPLLLPPLIEPLPVFPESFAPVFVDLTGPELTNGIIAASVGAEALAGPENAAQRDRMYVIAKGDTLLKIVQREWNSRDPRLIEMLVNFNPALRGRETRLAIGEQIVIPDVTFAQRALAGERVAPIVAAVETPRESEPPAREHAAKRGAPRESKPAARTAAAAKSKPDAKTKQADWYTIRANDSLAAIAQRCLKNESRWHEIVALNGKLDPQRIVPGTRIKLPPLAHAGKH